MHNNQASWDKVFAYLNKNSFIIFSGGMIGAILIIVVSFAFNILFGLSVDANSLINVGIGLCAWNAFLSTKQPDLEKELKLINESFCYMVSSVIFLIIAV